MIQNFQKEVINTSKIVLMISYFLLSLVIFFFLYHRASIKINEIWFILKDNIFLFLVGFFFSFGAFVLKVYRWSIFVKIFSVFEYNFFFLLNLSSISTLLASVGLNLVFSDGVKSGVLVFKQENLGSKFWVFSSSYMDRLVGLLASLVLALLFFYKNYVLFLIFFVVGGSIIFFYFNKGGVYRVLIVAFFISLFSQLIDSLALYGFWIFVFNQDITFFDWFIAFVVGSIGSLLSAFGGLGGRTIGMSLLLGQQNIKNILMIDIVYYLLQLFSALLGISIFFIYKSFFNKNKQ